MLHGDIHNIAKVSLTSVHPMMSFGTLFDADFVEFDEGDFPRYLMVCHPCLEVKASLERLKALTSKHG